MKRTAVVKKLKKAAKAAGLSFEQVELTRHTSFKVGTSAHTLKRHSEIDEVTARAFFAQYADVLGKGWWR